MTLVASRKTLACMDIVWKASVLLLHAVLLTIAAPAASGSGSGGGGGGGGLSPLRFTVEPTDVVVSRGQPALLNCSASQGGQQKAPSMAWTHDGVAINFDGDERRHKLANGSLYLSQVEHTRSHRPDEGEYQCVATVPGLGTIVSRKAAIQVAYLSKSFSAEPAGLAVYLEDTAMFECLINGAPTPEVRWLKDEQEVQPSPNVVLHLDGVLEVLSVQFTDLGHYKCRAENAERSRTSAVAELKQEGDVSSYEGVAPHFILTPKDRVSLEGSIVVFNCGANGRDSNGNRPTVTWLRDGITIDTQSEGSRFSVIGQGSLRIDNIIETDAGLYTCRVTNSEDSVDADASLTVHVPPRFNTRPQNVEARVKSEVQLECDVIGVPRPNIVWLKNGDLFTPSDYFQIIDGRNLRILGLLESDAGIYQCLAENDVGNIQASAQLVVLPQGGSPGGTAPAPATIPSEPTELHAVIVSQRFVTLSWRLPQHMGSTDIMYYSVYWMEEGSHRERMLNTTALEANIQHLKPATQYHFRILAHNAAGPSGEAATVTVDTNAEVNVPGPPTAVSASPISPSAIHIMWESPQVTNGQITNYKLYYYAAGETDEHDVNVEGHEYTLNDLAKFQEYTFRVVAYNNIGAGTTSQEMTAHTYSDVPNEPPQNVTVETGSSTSVVLRWQPPPEGAQNGLITGYKIRYKEKGDRKGETITTDANIRSKEIANLAKGTEYQVRIQALTVNGSGPATPWYFTETYLHDLDESEVPVMPSSLRVRSMTNSIVASWTPPRQAHIMVRGYILGYGIGIPDVYKQVLDAKQRSHTIKNLRPSSSYVISLRAFNNVGEGRPIYETGETREEIVEEPLTPMTPPVGLKAQVLSSTTIMLTWSDNLLGRNQRITDSRFYTVRYNLKMARRYKYVNSTDLNIHIDDLKPNTEYEFSVKVLKGRRKSTWSLSVFNRTWEAAPATAPRDLTPVAVEGKPHWVTLNWQPPRQPNGQITGYLVFYTTDPTHKDRDWVVDGTVGEKLSTTIKDLTPETTYYFKVQARNDKGYGPMSPTVIFRTPSADGTGGGRIELPDDYGKSNIRGGRKGGSTYYSHQYPTPETRESTGGSKSLVLWISIGCVCGVSIIAIIIVTVLLCKRNNNRTRKGYQPANKKPMCKPGPKDLKPPDLWVDHDQVELKNMDSSMGMTTTLPVGSKDDASGERNYNPHQSDQRFHQTPFKPKPIMIPVEQSPPPTIATAITNGHLTIGGPENPPVVVNPTPIRPMHPRAQYPPQYSSTPRVNATEISTQPSSVKPQQQQQQQQQQGSSKGKQPAPSAGNKARSPMPVIMPKAPDVIRTNKAEDPDMPKSFSTEELTAEMANLEGLMKDLNAITQQEFEC